MTSVTGLRHGDSLRLLERGAVVNQQEMGQIGTREDYCYEQLGVRALGNILAEYRIRLNKQGGTLYTPGTSSPAGEAY